MISKSLSQSQRLISSDDASILKIAQELQIEVPFVRPHELATDSSSSIDVVQHAIEFLESQGEFYDAVCLLQPTTPFRSNGFLDVAIHSKTGVFYDDIRRIQSFTVTTTKRDIGLCRLETKWELDDLEGEL